MNRGIRANSTPSAAHESLKTVACDANGRLLVVASGTPGSTLIVAQDSSVLYAGTTALTPKFKVIDFAGSGDNAVVAAVPGKKIRVLQVMMIAAGTVTARFESAAGGTALTGQTQLTAQAGFTLPFSPIGWFETAAGEALNLELSAAVSVDGVLGYVEV